MKLDAIKAKLAERLEQDGGAVGLYFSGGSDSLLLLQILMDLKAKFSIVCWDHSFTREQRRYLDSLIQTYGLRVFSYRPSVAYFIGDGKEKISLVEEYALPAGTLPVMRDAAHDPSRCAVTDVKLGPWHVGPAPVGFTLGIFGTRKTDRHFATGKAWQASEWVQGPTTYIAPLWDLTRKDVKECLTHYGVKWPKVDTGEIPICLRCLTGQGKVLCPKTNEMIDTIDWSPKGMLDAFQQKYGFV